MSPNADRGVYDPDRPVTAGPEPESPASGDVLVTQPAESCLNCGAGLTGDFCARCGQKASRTDLSLREFLREASGELTHWEGKVPQTLKTLFLEPGRLTLDFLSGRRARWLAPLRVYLICSLAFFLAKPLVERFTHRSAQEIGQHTVTNPDGSITLTPEGRQVLSQGMPGRLFGIERLERAAANPQRLNDALTTAYPKAMFVFLPLLALLTWVGWRRSQPHYPAHLYLALHLHALWFGVLAINTVAMAFLEPETGPAVAIGSVATLYVLWYNFRAVRRVFGEPWPRTIVKGTLVSLAYGIVLFAGSLVMIGWVVLTT